MSASPHEFRAGELIPSTRYRVVRLLGEGGMGWILEVEHVELGRPLVVKVLRPECARRSDLVERLRTEWRALGKLQHPNIVAVTDAGQTPAGMPYFVMERLDGEPLSRRMRREGRMSIPSSLDIAAQVLDGLAAAHGIGIVHRDIKPPNVFLVYDEDALQDSYAFRARQAWCRSSRSPNGSALRAVQVKLLDFGVVKMRNARSRVVTADGIAIGTPRYMSPEQADGGPVDGRADLYATGLILFEMLTGRSPFENARDTNEMMLAHLGRPPPPLSHLAPGVTPELEFAVGRMLAKTPAERPPTAREAAATLRALAASYQQPVPSEPTTTPLSYTTSTEPEEARPQAAVPWLLPPGGLEATAWPGAERGSGEAWLEQTTEVFARELPPVQTAEPAAGGQPTMAGEALEPFGPDTATAPAPIAGDPACDPRVPTQEPTLRMDPVDEDPEAPLPETRTSVSSNYLPAPSPETTIPRRVAPAMSAPAWLRGGVVALGAAGVVLATLAIYRGSVGRAATPERLSAGEASESLPRAAEPGALEPRVGQGAATPLGVRAGGSGVSVQAASLGVAEVEASPATSGQRPAPDAALGRTHAGAPNRVVSTQPVEPRHSLMGSSPERSERAAGAADTRLPSRASSSTVASRPGSPARRGAARLPGSGL